MKIPMRYYRILFFVFVITLWAVWFSGCGIVGKPVYYIARDPNWYPLALLGKEKNVLAFSDDLLMEIAKIEGFEVSTIVTNSNSLEIGLDIGIFDAAMTTLKPTPFRQDKYCFSDPYFFSGPILVVPAESTASSLIDMDHKRVAVRTGALRVFQIDTHPEITFQFYDNIIHGLDSMLHGELDGVIMDLVPAYGFSQGVYRGRIKVVGAPLTTAGIRLVANREKAPQLVMYFNRGLKELEENGVYRQLLEKWGLVNPRTLQEISQDYHR